MDTPTLTFLWYCHIYSIAISFYATVIVAFVILLYWIPVYYGPCFNDIFFRLCPLFYETSIIPLDLVSYELCLW